MVSIEIQQDSRAVYVDSTAQFTAVGKDRNGDDVTGLSFTWKSADTTIATIGNDGVVTGVAPGNTTVTAKLQEVESLPANVRVLETSTVTDIDGNIYLTVKIGDYWWMAENLKVTHYRNGDAIPNVTDNTEWDNLTTGAYCNYDNNASNTETYGSLYNWYAVTDGRNIAPEGWHVPNDDEWKQLEMFLGMSQSESDGMEWPGTDEGSKHKSISGWNNDDNGTDDYGFNALPGGYRSRNNGRFEDMGDTAGFWSSTEYDSSHARNRVLSYGGGGIWRSYNDTPFGISVRLVRD